ncbi:MAG TPA: carbohydrate kinase [Candidatus Koribacter sp.]|jgi:fructokinase
MGKFCVVGLGEVLWDVFSDHKELGGAPANFAYISRRLGDGGITASRVGNDELGRAALQRLDGLGLPISQLQVDENHPTGTVRVEVAADGQPTFEITKQVAWDFLAWTPEWEALAARADAVCFGTLAQRMPQSQGTIQKFVEKTRRDALRVFDVNLRQAFYSEEVLAESAQRADILKLNHEEVPIAAKLLGASPGSDLDFGRWLCREFALKLVCVTRGGAGSLLVSPRDHHDHRGIAVQVADTVGAGDAFTAALVHHYLRGADPGVMNDCANRMGALVASRRGATPTFTRDEIASVTLEPV